jgi:rhodanese-related sulfurtransferase
MKQFLARAYRQAAILFFLALLPAVVSGTVQLKWQPAPPKAPGEPPANSGSGSIDWKKDEPLAPDEVRVSTARSWGKDVIYVDARLRPRYEAGHIDGAILLNHEEWDAQINKFLDAWDPDRKVVVYCDGETCDAARSIADRMKRDLQVQNIYVLKGGWPEWQSH